MLAAAAVAVAAAVSQRCRAQSMLQLKSAPLLRVHDDTAEALESTKTVGAYFQSHGDTADGFLHISIDLT